MRHLTVAAALSALCLSFSAVAATPAPAQPTRAKVAKSAPLCAPFAVKEARLAHDVAERRTVGEADVYEPGDTVHALAVVRNPGDRAPIEMIWKRDDVVRSRVKLDVGTSAGWRTWSKHRLGKKDLGAWTVEIRSEDGSLLETLSFEVTRSIAGI